MCSFLNFEVRLTLHQKMSEQFAYSPSSLMDFLRLNKLYLRMKMHILTCWMFVALSFLLMTYYFFTIFINGLYSSFDDEDASFNFLDSCSFGL